MDPRQTFVFDYSSPFSYGSSNSDQWINDDSRNRKRDLFQESLYVLLISFSVLFFLVTFPVSSFFYVKKINSLQRCLTYRLGRRLPLKGPGFIIALPFIDQTRIIDLYERIFEILENEQQMLTGDGSIICIQPCQATLNITDALLTTSKINNVDIKQFLRLRFANLIQSKHVEDLENKMDFLIRGFEEEMNGFLRKWGYGMGMCELPRISVLDRADPMNPIKMRIKKFLNPADDNPLSSNSSPGLISPTNDGNDALLQRLTSTIELLIEPYKGYLKKYDAFNLRVKIIESDQLFHFQYDQNRGIYPVIGDVPFIHMTVQFNNFNDLNQFLMTRDPKFVTYMMH